MKQGLFISFEGTEGAGKSTQIRRLDQRLSKLGYVVRMLREPGGTSIGEEIRHTLQHSAANHAMTPEAELLLVNASRAQLVREVIRPALMDGQVVLCDRFFDSTTAYQGYGRQLDLSQVQWVIDWAVAGTRPDLTLLLHIPLELSQTRRGRREAGSAGARDRMEEGDPAFFQRVEQGFLAVATADPSRVKLIDASADLDEVERAIWAVVEPALSVKNLKTDR